MFAESTTRLVLCETLRGAVSNMRQSDKARPRMLRRGDCPEGGEEVKWPRARTVVFILFSPVRSVTPNSAFASFSFESPLESGLFCRILSPATPTFRFPFPV